MRWRTAGGGRGAGEPMRGPPDASGAPNPPSIIGGYVYDPANDPTPDARCGPTFHAWACGVGAQATVEARADVLVFTSPPVARAVTAVGPLAGPCDHGFFWGVWGVCGPERLQRGCRFKAQGPFGPGLIHQ